MDAEIPTEFTEAYRVLETLSLEHAQGGFRLEVVAALKNKNVAFSVQYFERKADTWQRMTGVPWVGASSQDTAAHQGLHFLVKHLNERGRPR